jgi:hypothetical protein
MAVFMPVREPTTFDLSDWIGFKVDKPEDDDDGTRIVADDIEPGQWSGACPACDATMDDPSVASADEDGDRVTWRPDCGAWAETVDGASGIVVWTVVDWQALAPTR